MRSLMTPFAAGVAAIVFLAPSAASASHDAPLYQAASSYREAVRDFERAVIRSPYQDRFARRVADQLEDASSRFRSAARHPEKLDRLLGEWHQIQQLQPHLASVIFANPRCPSRVDLLPCWERVTCAYGEIARQLAPYCASLVAPGAIPAIPPTAPCYEDETCPLTGVVVPSYRVPSYRVPNYQLPNYRVPSYRAPNYQVPSYRAPSYQVPGNRVPSYGVPSDPGNGIPSDEARNDRVPMDRFPQDRVLSPFGRKLVAPIPIEPQPKVPLTHPSHWRE